MEIKRTKPILPQVIIFIVIYILELSSYYYFGYFKVYPKIKQVRYENAQKYVSQSIIDEQKNIYALIDNKKGAEASTRAEIMLKNSATNWEKALSYQVLGEVALFNKRDSQAEDYFNKGYLLNQNLHGIQLGLAVVHLNRGEYKEAVEKAKKSVDLDTSTNKNFYGFYVLALAYYGDGNKTLAFQAIEKAIQINPNLEYLKAFRGEVVKFMNQKPTQK